MLSKRIDKVNKALMAITTSLKSVPSRWEFHLHARKIQEPMKQIIEMNTGLTTAMHGCKFSESSPYDFRRSSAVSGP